MKAVQTQIGDTKVFIEANPEILDVVGGQNVRRQTAATGVDEETAPKSRHQSTPTTMGNCNDSKADFLIARKDGNAGFTEELALTGSTMHQNAGIPAAFAQAQFRERPMGPKMAFGNWE
jgi:hypothetical protein